MNSTPEVLPALSNRAEFVIERLSQISNTVSEAILENAQLLGELKANAYYREYGFATFDECIEALHERGQIDYGPRQARNFLAINRFISELALDSETIHELGISRLRALATVPVDKPLKEKLLNEAKGKTVSEVEQLAKAARGTAMGHDTDPLKPLTLMITESQRLVYKEAIGHARKVAGASDDEGEAGLLIDVILADWLSGQVAEVTWNDGQEPERDEEP